jgi:hypothetical protein
MVGKEMARARLPAILMSTANSSTIVGDEQLAAGDTHQSGHDANADAGR